MRASRRSGGRVGDGRWRGRYRARGSTAALPAPGGDHRERRCHRKDPTSRATDPSPSSGPVPDLERSPGDPRTPAVRAVRDEYALESEFSTKSGQDPAFGRRFGVSRCYSQRRMTTPTKPRPTRAPRSGLAGAKPTGDSLDQKALQAAWTPGEPSPEAWTPRPWVSVDQRVAAGRAARQNAPRSAQGAVDLPADRDPIAILNAQEQDRLPELVPLRHARMAESAFAYYRGTPAVMATDLAATPRSGIIVQASGDAHLSNFGLFASPERQLVFDANDFDETLPGPWEWDVKRLAASMMIASRSNGFTAAEGRDGDARHRPGISRSPGAIRRDAPARDLVRPDDVRLDRGRNDVRSADHEGRRREAGPGAGRCDVREGPKQGHASRGGQPHRCGRRPVANRRHATRRVPHRDPGRADRPRPDVQRLPGKPRGEPARTRRAVPVRRFRVEGGWRRERRNALLHHPARGPG